MAVAMMQALDRRIWLLVVSLAIAVVVPLLLLWPEQQLLPSAEWPKPTPLVGNTVAAAEPLGRNLFVATRPNVDPAAAPAPAEPPKLVGIALHLRGKGVAVVRLASGETQNLSIGDVADGWTLVALNAKAATFTGPAGSVTTTLDFGNKAPSPGKLLPPSVAAATPRPQRTN